MTPPSPHRLDYLDAVRACALLLGIVFHASLSFIPVYIGWAVMDINTSEGLSLWVLVSHAFRMPLFFFIAGFFSRSSFHRHGGKGFLQNRCLRLAVPFIVAWFILRPLLVSGWLMGAQSLRGSVDVLQALSDGFATLGQLPQGLFIGTHLWFLYYLLIISAGVLALRCLAPLSWLAKADALVRWLCRARCGLLALSLPIALNLWFMQQWGLDTPDKSLLPHLPVFGVYSMFFLLGWLLQRQSNLITDFSRLSWGKGLLCLLAIVAASKLSAYAMQQGQPDYHYLKAAFCLSYALMMCSLVMLSIGLFKRYFNRPGKTLRYLAQAAYWLYLVHLPIVVWLQVALAEVTLHWLIKLGGIFSLSLALSLVLYELGVRRTFIGAALNGRRQGAVLNYSPKNNPKVV